MALTQGQRLNQATPITDNNVGTVGFADYISATEYGNGIEHVTALYLNALPVTTGNTTGISFGSKLLYTFPEGGIMVRGSNVYFSRISFNTAAGSDGDIAGGGSGDYSIGSTATADGTLNSTDVDILPSTAMLDPFVAGVGTSNVAAGLATPAYFQKNTAALTAYLNAIIDDADVADAAASDLVYFTGHVWIAWTFLGNLV
jgi:hypothetical protein